MQPSSVLLPDFFLGPRKIVPSALTEKKLLLHEVEAAASSQKGLLPGDFEKFLQKTFNERQIFFSGAGKGSRQECSTVLEQTNPHAVPGKHGPWVGPHTYNLVTDLTEEQPPPSSFGGGRSGGIMRSA